MVCHIYLDNPKETRVFLGTVLCLTLKPGSTTEMSERSLQLESEYSAACLILGLKRSDHITPALMDLHWLPYPQRITYKLCMIMFCLLGSVPAYLADYCNSTSWVPGRSTLRSAAHGDIVVPSHRTDWDLRSFAVTGPSSWNALPVGLRSSYFSLETFAKHLKTHLFGLAYSRQSTHFWVCITFCRVRHNDSVTKPSYYYYYYYIYYYYYFYRF